VQAAAHEVGAVDQRIGDVERERVHVE